MPARLTFQFLDVGQGDGTLVQMRRHGVAFDRLLLVDFGEQGSPLKVAHEDALAYLVEQIDENSTARGAATPYIDVLVLTHPDADHFNKVPALLTATYPRFPAARLRIGSVRYSGNPEEYGTLITTKLKGRVDHAKGLARLPNRAHSKLNVHGDLIPWETFGPIRTYLLSSNWPKRNGKTNPKSIVLMFELDGKQVILCGDATKATEGFILKKVLGGDPDLVDCHGLKLGHHASKGSSGVAWVGATEPLAIFASGDQVWAHPYCKAICRFVNADTLEEHFADDSYYTCGDDGAYHNNETRLAIGMNLWYVVQRKRERLTDEETGAFVWAYKDNVFGVQWELSIEAGHDIAISRTETCVPDSANVTKPFDCTAVTLEDERREELLQLADALPVDGVPA